MNLLSSVTSLALVALAVSFAPPPTAESVVLRLEKMRPYIPGVPDEADFRVKSGARAFVSCELQRAYPSGEVEHGCRTYDESRNRWSKSVGWYSADTLQPLTKDNARIMTASRKSGSRFE